MKYIYTSSQCPKCDELKKKYNEFGIAYIERMSDRMKAPEDDIDIQALVQASMQNLALPVIIEI